MKALEEKTEDLIDIATKLVICLAKEDELEERTCLPLFTEKMLGTVPGIIKAYTRPELAAVKEDMVYWTQQIKRILEALESQDRFLLIDIIKFETIENLKLFKEMISGVE